MSDNKAKRGDEAKGGSRRAVLKAGLTAMAAGVAALAGTEQVRAQPAQKLAQKVVQYQPHPNGNAECDKCVNWIAPNSCKIVAGTISPKGWCVAFAPKSA